MIVLDAAALVDVVADQPAREWVLERLQGEDIVAPAHQPAEVRAVGEWPSLGDGSSFQRP